MNDELHNLLTAVKDEHLTKTDLEKYRDSMVHMHTQFQIALAGIEKRGALFFMERKKATPESSDISIKREWRASNDGLQEIELNRYIKAIAQEIKSLRDRLYNLY